jgi:hypothetical protein
MTGCRSLPAPHVFRLLVGLGTFGHARERALSRQRRFRRSSAVAPAPARLASQQPGDEVGAADAGTAVQVDRTAFREGAVERVEDLLHVRIGFRHAVVADGLPEVGDRTAGLQCARASARMTGIQPGRSGR